MAAGDLKNREKKFFRRNAEVSAIFDVYYNKFNGCYWDTEWLEMLGFSDDYDESLLSPQDE